MNLKRLIVIIGIKCFFKPLVLDECPEVTTDPGSDFINYLTMGDMDSLKVL
jgi:hypothetical protein